MIVANENLSVEWLTQSVSQIRVAFAAVATACPPLQTILCWRKCIGQRHASVGKDVIKPGGSRSSIWAPPSSSSSKVQSLMIEYHALVVYGHVTWLSGRSNHWCLLWRTRVSQTGSPMMAVHSTYVQLPGRKSICRRLSGHKKHYTSEGTGGRDGRISIFGCAADNENVGRWNVMTECGWLHCVS